MTAAVETMAYANEVPWHGLGTAVSDNLTPAQMVKAAKLAWKVEKRKLHYPGAAGKLIEVPGQFALTRDSDHKVLSLVGAAYKPIQNEDAMDFFSKFVKAGHMKMETAGSLWDGRYIWGLARVGKDFILGKKDEVRSYLLMCSPHVLGKAMVFQYTPIRVVCWNTLTWALGSRLKGGEGAFRVIHSQKFDDNMKTRAELALGLATSESESFQAAATLLSKKKAKTEEVEEFFCEVLRFDPKAKKKDEADKTPREPLMLPKFRTALAHAPGAAINTAAGTWWGALNAVTYTIDHDMGRDRTTALKNVWLGHQANVKRRAFDLALDRAK